MDGIKPIRTLMRISLTAYAVYALLYLFIVFGPPIVIPLPQPDTFFVLSQRFVVSLPIPYHILLGLVLLPVSGVARILFCRLVVRYTRAGTYRPLSLIGVCCLVLLILPAFVKPFYNAILINILAWHRPELLPSNRALQESISYIAPALSLANLFAFAGCALAWYRNRHLAHAHTDHSTCLSQNP